jgi:multiple sugar transport system substrate-binding protein
MSKQTGGRPFSRRGVLALAGAAIGSTVVAAACAAPEQPAATSGGQTGASSKAPTTMRFTTWWTPIEKDLGDVKGTFEAAHPGVTVNLEMVTDQFVPKMEASLVAGTWGDASISENSVQVKFEDAGFHLPLDDRLKKDKISLQDNYSLIGIEIWQGKALLMPFDNDPRAIYYNKTAFKEAGAKDPWVDFKGKWTWDDMVQAAKLTTKKDGAKTVRYGLQWNYNSYQEFAPLVWTMGGNYADWKTLKYTLEDANVAKAINMLLQWGKTDGFMLTNEGISELMGASGANPFRAGLAAMYHRAAYDNNLMVDAIQDKFEWDVAPFPDMDGSHPGTPVTSGNPHFVPAATKIPDIAYDWVRELASDRVQQYFAGKKTFVPSNKNAWKAYQEKQPPGHSESFVHWVYSRPHGFHFYNAGMSAAGTAIANEIDLVFLGKKPVPQALKDANTAANQVVNFGKATNPFPFTVPVPPESNLSKWGVG